MYYIHTSVPVFIGNLIAIGGHYLNLEVKSCSPIVSQQGFFQTLFANGHSNPFRFLKFLICISVRILASASVLFRPTVRLNLAQYFDT
jgi:hypothetical protein